MRTRDQLLSEAEMLAALWSDRRVDMILAFAPPVHLYGLLTTLLLPAVLGVPVCYQRGFDIPPPPVAGRGVGVAAIPWTFRILSRHRAHLSEAAQISVLHSTARLPPEAVDIVASIDTAGPAVTEVFGSTETGGIAHRSHPNREWTLFDDVTLTDGAASGDVSLVVASPRLAATLTNWDTGDLGEIVGTRRLLIHGRRTRLRKVNGVRVDLDQVENRLRDAARCIDLACIPVADAVRGENFSVLAVAPDGEADDLLTARIRGAARSLGLSPDAIRIVAQIDRTETGKLRG